MNELKKALIENSIEVGGKRKLPCAQAFAIASTFDLPPSKIGTLCNEENISICKCQLHCFE